MSRIDFVRPGGQWSPEMVPGASDYQRWDVNQSKLVSGDLGGNSFPTRPIVIGAPGGLTSAVTLASGGVATATGGRAIIASSANDMPSLSPPRTRTISVPLLGNVVSPSDMTSPVTFMQVTDDVNGWGIKATGGGFLAIAVPGEYLHIGSQILQASLTYVVTKRPTAVPGSPMYLFMYALSDANAKSYGNPSVASLAIPGISTGNIGPWAPSILEALGSYILPMTQPPGPAYYYKATSVSGTGTTGSSEPTWPTTVGATVTDNLGPNQIVWTCTGLVGASFGAGETVSSYWNNGAPQALTMQYDGAGSGTYSNVISAGLRYAFVVNEVDPTILITGLDLTFSGITSMAFP